MPDLKEIRIFISYANEDRINLWLENIKNNCLSFNDNQNVTIWDDGNILLGQEWDGIIKKRLDESDIVLLLISKDFLRSKYINNVELTAALARHQNKQCRVIPIFVRHCSLDDYPQITNLQGFPKGLFFSDMEKEIDKYYTELEQAIKNVITEIRTNAGMQAAPQENKEHAETIMQQESTLPKIALAHAGSVLSNTMKQFFLTEVERERKYKGWKFDVEEHNYNNLPGFENASVFTVHIITSEADIQEAANSIGVINEDENHYKKTIFWVSETALEEKLPTAFKSNKIVVGTMPAKLIEMIYLVEKERLESLKNKREKFSQQMNVYMLYDYEKDHNNMVRINLKEKLESKNELLTFFNPPNPSVNSIEEQLQLSKGAIIFYGTADTNWYCYWQSEVQKISTLKSKAVCLSEPEKTMKIKRDVSKSAFIVMEDEQKLDDYVTQFVNNLKMHA